MALSPALLEILACPDDKGPLLYLETESLLYNPRLHRRYDIRDDIPVMLISEATDVGADEHDRLMKMVGDLEIEPTFAETAGDAEEGSSEG